MSEHAPLPPSGMATVQKSAKRGCGVLGRLGLLLAFSVVMLAAGLFLWNTLFSFQKKSFLEEAAQQMIKSDEMSIGIALEAYRAASGNYPTAEQGLDALVRRPTQEPIPNRWYPYFQELPKDPWKQLYKYRIPATKSGKGYDVYSVGKDGVDGSADDIGNW